MTYNLKGERRKKKRKRREERGEQREIPPFRFLAEMCSLYEFVCERERRERLWEEERREERNISRLFSFGLKTESEVNLGLKMELFGLYWLN